MKYYFLTIILVLTTFYVNGQNLYIKTFGSHTETPIIFLHGGPGSSSASFELTTAKQLASRGFYVIVYDRRGEGRSTDSTARYDFQQTFNDLNTIYRRYAIKRAILIGNSFGGIIGSLYTRKYSGRVKELILSSSLLSLQDTYQAILSKTKKIYQSKNDRTGLKVVDEVEKKDYSSLEFRTDCFKFATDNNFFNTPHRNKTAERLYALVDSNPVQIKLRADTSSSASFGFWKHEHYTTIDIKPVIKTILARHINVYAVYGQDDRLFSRAQINQLKTLLPANHLLYLKDCSHSVFIDQQRIFLNALEKWCQ